MNELSYFYKIMSKIKKQEETTFGLLERKSTESIVNKIVKAVGSKEPSSETMSHWFIYNKMPALTAIFHGHNDKILASAETLGLPITKNESPYGSKKEITEISKILDRGNFLILKGHGFLSLGRTMGEAGNEALKWLKFSNP